jgi:hypothetical protein
MYEYEEMFQRQYPNNNTIRFKVRQVLQYLAKKGYVKHIGVGQWRKM